MCEELALLKKYEGRIWNKESQKEFANELGSSENFEGAVSAKYPDFSARDRINRSPKTFGFIYIDKDKKIHITPAGDQLIKREQMEDLFLRQLLKWQYPSPNHDGSSYQNFRIKPFLEILRLVKDLDGLSKKEIAMFGLSFTNYNDYGKVKSEIAEYRLRFEQMKGKRDKGTFQRDTHEAVFRYVYRDDIASGNTELRERSDKQKDANDFLKTKIRNSLDYADSAMRYFRATGIFSLSSRNFRLRITDAKLELVESILKAADREPVDFNVSKDFFNYFGDQNVPSLPDDDILALRGIVLNTVDRLFDLGTILSDEFSVANTEKMNLLELKRAKSRLENLERQAVVDRQIRELQTYWDYKDVLEVFEKILDRRDSDIPDKPIFFEWNIWRTMCMLDDGNIHANLVFDFEGKPFSGAPSKTADIVCEYKEFILVIEVTLMSGSKQYDSEGEPVARHVGDLKKKFELLGDPRPVYGLFIAPKVSEATVAHFFILKRTSIAFYGGKSSIIPFDLKNLLLILEKAKNSGGTKSSAILNLINQADELATKSVDEKEWSDSIAGLAEQWEPRNVSVV